MDFLKSLTTAAAGLKAQSSRMRIIAENIANADSAPATAGAELARAEAELARGGARPRRGGARPPPVLEEERVARRGAAVGERGQAAGAGGRARGWTATGPSKRDPARGDVDLPELDGHGAAGAGSGRGAVDPPELEVPRAADSPEMGEGRERGAVVEKERHPVLPIPGASCSARRAGEGAPPP